MEVSLRKATKDDIPELAILRTRFLEEILGKDERAPLLISELKTYFNNAFDDNLIHIWVAESESQIVSTSTMVIWHAPIGFDGLGKSGKRGYVLNMFTIKEFRRQGIALQLLKKLLNDAKELNLERVHLHATQDGYNLYENLGFARTYYPELEVKF